MTRRERCVVARCREPVSIEVLGKLYCTKHNAERLDIDARIEADIREVLE